MAKQSLNLGSAANDNTGDTLRAGGTKINDNFNELYAAIGNGATIQIDVTNAASGTLKMSLPYATTANISAGKYYYDLEIYNSSANSITRLLQGVARVTQNVTR